MVQEQEGVEEQAGCPVAKAHLALKSETDNLEKLAQWCEDNFFSVGTAPVHKDLDDGSSRPSDVLGGERLHQTADYAIRYFFAS